MAKKKKVIKRFEDLKEDIKKDEGIRKPIQKKIKRSDRFSTVDFWKKKRSEKA